MGECRFAKENQSLDRYDISLPLPSKEDGTSYKIQMEFDISTEVVSKTEEKNWGRNTWPTVKSLSSDLVIKSRLNIFMDVSSKSCSFLILTEIKYLVKINIR